MKQNSQKPQLKISKKQEERLRSAKVSYDKMSQEIAPFTPKIFSKEVSTEGKWESSTLLSFY